jgi:hypothetical protein
MIHFLGGTVWGTVFFGWERQRKPYLNMRNVWDPHVEHGEHVIRKQEMKVFKGKV